jgi:hypothetical protein
MGAPLRFSGRPIDERSLDKLGMTGLGGGGIWRRHRRGSKHGGLQLHVGWRAVPVAMPRPRRGSLKATEGTEHRSY